ncbi:MAG: cache domain-containing protein [Desulfobulbus sp.]|jgi:PAS domain S-box-containing protein/putative nucleotidyltransferase with HDIG domain|uniref:cache domain-containing protein n=1 Tax=Desulfobulbus sp. TaxID=895 RepID=UPI0028431427|nr:HD domain-containing phosphohydrolase [Desulfobulbus sp.]MDR2549478.1 cache domain-containing protein [Desulfobulbus sp.]
MEKDKKRKFAHAISIRIALPALLTVVLFVTATFVIILPSFKENLLAKKREMLREMNTVVWDMVASYERMERAGTMSREQAQQTALSIIRDIRYGPVNKDYFWVNDMQGLIVMHPYRPDLRGETVPDVRYPLDRNLLEEFVKVAENQGAGYVDYRFQWQDDPGKIVPKLSYVRGFTPWGWVVGTGMYIEDVNVEIGLIAKQLNAIASVILLLVSFLAFYMIRHTVLADRVRRIIWEERERLLTALEESRERFRALVETTSDWIWEINAKGVYTYCSPKVRDLLGFAPEELIGKHLVDLIAIQEVERTSRLFRKLIDSRQPFSGFETVCQTRDGRIVVIEKNGVPVFADSGALLGYRGVSRDISERKHALEALEKSRDALHNSLEETVKSLALAAEKRDPYTAGHQMRVDRLACAIARELGLSEDRIEGLHFAALLHDIGKISLPSEYLAKPARLSAQERAIIKCHTEVGYEILKDIPFPWPVADIVHQHHEHLDGSGYPQGLTAKDLLLESQILTVADVVEAMSSHRPYRPSLGLETALSEVRAGRGTLYHPASVDACLKLIAEKKVDLSAAAW